MSLSLPIQSCLRRLQTCLSKVGLAGVMVIFGAVCALAGTTSASSASGQPAVDPASLYIKVRLEHTVKMSSLKPGDSLSGSLADDVYSGEHKVFPSGSPVRLTVDKLQRRKRPLNDHWPWIIRVFSPRHENYPLFASASVTQPDGHAVPLTVSLISLGSKVEVRPIKRDKGKNAKSAAEVLPPTDSKSTKKPAQPVITLEGSSASVAGLTADEPVAPAAKTESSSFVPGTQAKVILLNDLSAGKNRAGDRFQARLIQPLYSGSTLVLPAGSIFDGEVLKSTPPRWASRAGSIYLKFTGVNLGGTTVPVAATISRAEVDEQSHTVLDPEGQLKGAHPGKLWMLANIGVSSAMGKAADDGTQLVIEAFSSTATDASTAGVARIASATAAGIMMVTRHGRDVVLPRFTEMNIVFDRP